MSVAQGIPPKLLNDRLILLDFPLKVDSCSTASSSYIAPSQDDPTHPTSRLVAGDVTSQTRTTAAWPRGYKQSSLHFLTKIHNLSSNFCHSPPTTIALRNIHRALTTTTTTKMPLVVPGLQSKDGNSSDDWLSKLAGKKLGDQHDEMVRSCPLTRKHFATPMLCPLYPMPRDCCSHPSTTSRNAHEVER